jgi:hypothetical protein
MNVILEWELFGKRVFRRSEEDRIRTASERQVVRTRESGCNWFRLVFSGNHSY